MSTPRPVSVAILWHMHQPWYGDPRTGAMRLPWTRLHAVKDYLDMIAAARRHPECHVTFNLVPSLLRQMEAYAEGTTTDTALATARIDTSELTETQRLWWLRSGFQCHWPRQVEPHRRYRELLERRGRDLRGVDEAGLLRRFGTAELRDLQVWFHLAWCGQVVRRDPICESLLAKGRDFDEDDKQALLDLMDGALAGTLAEYRQAADDGHVELTTSPMYHPILPLLCHYPDVKAGLPGVSIPAGARDLPDDAAAQLEQGLRTCDRLLGRRPVGLWPSEGSVSSRALALARAAGFRWAATDEQILALSLAHGRPGPVRAALQQPWEHEGLTLFFRDHRLSDRIGFEYATWDPAVATADFIRGCEQAAAAAAGLERPVISVILDGENCWEHYADNGEPFLDRLYTALAEHPYLEPVTFSEHLDSAPRPAALEWLFPGSWINHDFYIWAGHRDDQRAWEQLFRTRAQLVEMAPTLTDEVRARAFEHLYIAEGSDWFWWYGDDHSSDDDPMFDALFREHLQRIWELCGQAPPADLHEANAARPAAPPLTPPSARFTPVLDGRETSFFEWRSAGHLEGGAPAGAMSRAAGASLIRRVRYGFDEKDAFVAVELALPRGESDDAWSLVLEATAAGRTARLVVPSPDQPGRHSLRIDSGPRRGPRAQAVIDQMLELSAPLRLLPAGVGETLELVLLLRRGGDTEERWPPDGAFCLPLPDEMARRCDWMV